MINKIKNILSTIKEDYRRDKDYREMAEHAYEDIVVGIKNKDMFQVAKYHRGDEYQGVGYQVETFEDKFLSIYFLFYPPTFNPQEGGHYSKSLNEIVIFIPLRNELYYKSLLDNQGYANIEQAKEIIEKESSSTLLKGTFVHEYTHYLDSKRFDFNKALRSYKNIHALRDIGKDTDSYYQHPVEYNAYVQGALSSYIHYMDKWSIADKLDSLKSFDNFINDLNLYVPKNVMDTPRFKKRIYGFYTNYKEQIQKQYDDIESIVTGEIRKFSKLDPSILKGYLDLNNPDWTPVDTIAKLKLASGYPEIYWYLNADKDLRLENKEYFKKAGDIINTSLKKMRDKYLSKKNK